MPVYEPPAHHSITVDRRAFVAKAPKIERRKSAKEHFFQQVVVSATAIADHPLARIAEASFSGLNFAIAS